MKNATLNCPLEAKAETVTAQSKSNFALSFWFLPKNRRQGLINFYALSRVVDDAVDDYPPDEAREKLAFWKHEVALCYEGKPTHPITQAMQQTIQEFKIPRNLIDLLLEGCEWDLSKNRYATFEELYQYCYRVAGCIGLVCMRIFGLKGELADQAAEELGLALQLTNILRDVKEDADRNRLYLPQEDIQRYRLTEDEVCKGVASKKLTLLLKLMAERAETYYHRAFTKMKQLPRRPLVAAWIMGKVYFKVLKKIQKRHYDVYSQRITVSKLGKLSLALKEWFRVLFAN